jgi:MFS family permease
MRDDMSAEAQASIKETHSESWLPLVVVSLTGLIMVFNVAALNMALGAIVVSFHAPVSSVQLAIVAYSLLVAAFTITGGKLSAVLGSRSTQIVGLTVYAAATAVTAFAPSVRTLTLAQAVAGLGAALLIPNGVAIVMQSYTGRQREVAVAAQAALTGIGLSLGLLFGGTLVSLSGWRAPFIALLIMQIAVLLVAISMRLPRSGHAVTKVDLPSVALSAAGTVITIGAVNQIGPWGLLTARPSAPISFFGISPALVMLAAGGLILGIFMARQRRLRLENSTPLLAPEILQSRVTRASLLYLLAGSFLLAGVAYLMLLYTQVILSYSAIQSALFILPLSLSAVVAAVAAPVMARRWPPRILVGGAVLLGSLATMMLATAVSRVWNRPLLWIAEIFIGLAVGIVIAVDTSVLMGSVPDSLSNDVASTQGVTYMGTAMGTAAAGAVLLSVLAGTATNLVDQHANLDLPPTVELSPTTVSFVSNYNLKALLSKPPWHLTAIQLDEAVQINVAARLAALRASLAMLALLVLCSIGAVRSLPGPKPQVSRREPIPWPTHDRRSKPQNPLGRRASELKELKISKTMTIDPEDHQ